MCRRPRKQLGLHCPQVPPPTKACEYIICMMYIHACTPAVCNELVWQTQYYKFWVHAHHERSPTIVCSSPGIQLPSRMMLSGICLALRSNSSASIEVHM